MHRKRSPSVAPVATVASTTNTLPGTARTTAWTSSVRKRRPVEAAVAVARRNRPAGGGGGMEEEAGGAGGGSHSAPPARASSRRARAAAASPSDSHQADSRRSPLPTAAWKAGWLVGSV